MNYLGLEIERPKIGVFDFTSCEGCELQLANKEGTLIDFLALLDIVNFREISSDKGRDYDIALIEGCISRNDEIGRLKEIRSTAKVLVALGSCACFGGIAHLKNRFSMEDVVEEVYGEHKVETIPVQKISDVVEVDLELPGCPVSKAEVEKVVVNIVTGTDITFPKYPVCVECKHNGNICVFDLGKICLGPITKAGCGAICPTGKVGCLGCRGPAEDLNFKSFLKIAKDKGFKKAEIKEKLSFFNAFDEVVNHEI